MGVQTDFDFETPYIFNQIKAGVVKGVQATNIELQSRIKIKLSQPGTGNLRRDGSRASREGEPPAPDTGDLRRSFTTGGIRRVIERATMVRGIVGQGSGLSEVKKYARALEYGYEPNNLKPRPYLDPVVREARRDGVAKKLIQFEVDLACKDINNRLNQ